MLSRLRVKNFKLLQDADIRFEKPLTVFIGPNAAGKSTVLEVLEFLRRCASEGLQEAVQAHGGMGSIRTAGATGPIEIETQWSFVTSRSDGSAKRKFELRWLLCLDAGAIGAKIRKESLHDHEAERLTTAEDGKRTLHDERKDSPPVAVQGQSQLAFAAFRDMNRFGALTMLRDVVAYTRYLGVLSTAAPWARASVERVSARDSVVLAPEPYVGAEGIGLANALYNMHTDHAEAWNTLERAFRAEYPFVKRIVFPADAGGSKISFAYEDMRFARQKIYASQMSDGMIAFLCLLAAVLQPEQRGVLALDEPDVHLHPSALRRFVSVCQHAVAPRRVVIVTHSNALLDALEDPAKVIRIVEPVAEGARIRSLDAEALGEWRKDYTLSEMRRTGMLDRDNTAYENGA